METHIIVGLRCAVCCTYYCSKAAAILLPLQDTRVALQCTTTIFACYDVSRYFNAPRHPDAVWRSGKPLLSSKKRVNYIAK